MNRISRQVVIGAFVAAALALGASAGQGERARTGVTSSGALSIVALHDESAHLAQLLQTCRDRILGEAFDTLGELAARLKQI